MLSLATPIRSKLYRLLWILGALLKAMLKWYKARRQVIYSKQEDTLMCRSVVTHAACYVQEEVPSPCSWFQRRRGGKLKNLTRQWMNNNVPPGWCTYRLWKAHGSFLIEYLAMFCSSLWCDPGYCCFHVFLTASVNESLVNLFHWTMVSTAPGNSS